PPRGEADAHTRNPFHAKMRSRAPSKLCLIATFLLRSRIRFTDVQARPSEFLDLTSVTLEEFHQLVPPFETAFHAHLAAWRLDGKPRIARRFTVYKNCPLPTPADRLLFILVYLKTYALQVVHGRLFGMGQSKAHQCIHVLLPALLTAL